ncbi:MAG: (d)CMP kinase [Eggerthellaceae bacterium]
MIIAIDGPSGAGKSSVSRAVASRLGFSCLDTGAMYRSIAWKALQEGVDLSDDEALGRIACTCKISFGHEPGDPAPRYVYVDGEDVTTLIRTAQIDQSVSRVSSVPQVRKALVAQQQRIGSEGNYVVDGRDIGTVVFPEAELKIFMTASPEVRAKRRVGQNKRRGVSNLNYEEVLADIIARDEQDANRAESPLRAAEDAVLVDTSDITFDQSVERVCDLARQRGMA